MKKVFVIPCTIRVKGAERAAKTFEWAQNFDPRADWEKEESNSDMWCIKYQFLVQDKE